MVVKMRMNLNVPIYTGANKTDLGLCQIQWATYDTMRSHNLVTENKLFTVWDGIPSNVNNYLDLTFKGQCVLAMSKEHNKSVVALKRGKKNVKV